MKKKSSEDKCNTINISLGLCIGTLIGVSIDNIGLGMLIGVLAGLCIGTLADTINNNKTLKK